MELTVEKIIEILNKAIEPPEINFSSGGFYVRKDNSGQYSLLGRFTNRWRDIDFHSNPLNGGEIISNAAHQEFSDWLDKNPQHAPELWTWHQWGTARKSRANWWSYTGNFFYANWPLTEEEAKAIDKFSKIYTPGMSFGFYVFDYDYTNGVIGKYRAFEASILPLENAANPWTTYSILSKEKNMRFNEKKREALIKVHGEPFVQALEADDEKDATALDSAGVDTKELTEVVAEEVQKEVSLEGFATQKEVVDALTRIEAVYGETLKTLVAEVADLKQQLASLKNAEVQAAKTAAAPMSVLANYMPKSILDNKATEGKEKGSAEIDGRSALAKKQPAAATTGRSFMDIVKSQRQGVAQ